ncbi:CdaR family protein [Solitalea canadensis]|uniref:YbbR-like protein n=1 Tax=Solitalea canadensis (strain ATCC 29591 / DSM 3403 / JCM 21819 / LMG 8368 / NBRC 15130 / NCIMB 12057 / USAM 9D) TaxID=929556 RepID=H8KRB4_SOLCM|nr:YbbR-like domain-containing protein [Solitalea canadensis]AFD07381.1 YbbR-like protein [Solitalea canadensis DSM 3403]
MSQNGNSWFEISKRDRRKIGLFMLCLLVAVAFWVVSSFANRYSFTVKTELILTNIPADKTLNVKNVEVITMDVEGTGWQLLFSKIDIFKSPLKLDMAQIKGDNVQLMEHVDLLNHQLPEGLKIVGISPASINIDFSSRIVKKVPLEIFADITFKKQYFYASDLILDPDSVTISGPIDEVSKIKFISTPKITLHNLSDSISTVINLAPKGTQNVNITPTAVGLKIPVEKFTEGSIDIPLTLINNQERFDVNLLPGKIKVKYLCPVSKYPLIDRDMFYAQVDLFQWKIQSKSRLDVKLLRSPDFIRVIKIEPQWVDFLVSK